MTLRNRLKSIERAMNPPSPDPIMMHGGWNEPLTSIMGDEIISIEPNETEEAFCTRMMIEARARKVPVFCVGAWPERPM